jgi:hypothetical protein
LQWQELKGDKGDKSMLKFVCFGLNNVKNVSFFGII